MEGPMLVVKDQFHCNKDVYGRGYTPTYLDHLLMCVCVALSCIDDFATVKGNCCDTVTLD